MIGFSVINAPANLAMILFALSVVVPALEPALVVVQRSPSSGHRLRRVAPPPALKSHSVSAELRATGKRTSQPSLRCSSATGRWQPGGLLGFPG